MDLVDIGNFSEGGANLRQPSGPPWHTGVCVGRTAAEVWFRVELKFIFFSTRVSQPRFWAGDTHEGPPPQQGDL